MLIASKPPAVDWFWELDDANGYPEVVFLPCSDRAWDEAPLQAGWEPENGLLAICPSGALAFRQLLLSVGHRVESLRESITNQVFQR